MGFFEVVYRPRGYIGRYRNRDRAIAAWKREYARDRQAKSMKQWLGGGAGAGAGAKKRKRSAKPPTKPRGDDDDDGGGGDRDGMKRAMAKILRQYQRGLDKVVGAPAAATAARAAASSDDRPPPGNGGKRRRRGGGAGAGAGAGAMACALAALTILLALLAPAAAYEHALEAAVLRNGALVPVPTPLYVVDVYMGGWNEFDLRVHPRLDLGTKIWYVPDPARVGNYSTANFGDAGYVRRRLALLRRSGLTPAIHIMSRHLIARTGDASEPYALKDWDDEGAFVNGTMRFSADLFHALYRPILEELKMPYMLIYDVWGFSDFAPAGMPAATFNKLYWEELGGMHRAIGLDPRAGPDNHHLRLHQYTDDRSFDSFSFAVYLYNGVYTGGTRGPLCDPRSLQMSLLLAMGAPGGTGANPFTGERLGLADVFWVTWYMFTPNVRACPALAKGQGTRNIVNSNQLSNFTVALQQEKWVEGVDDAGPRYFMGYIHHIHDKRATKTPRHTSVSGTDTERQFLTYRAREKGLVFASIWNDYEESIILEPAVRVGAPEDVHADANNATAGTTSFLSNLVRAKEAA